MQRSAIVALATALLPFVHPSTAAARPFRVAQVPNGWVAQCLTCHVYPGGPRNAFGHAIESYGGIGFLDGPAGNVLWGTLAVVDPAQPGAPPKTLAELDSDGDGRTNGQELLDPMGVWRTGVTNPGDPASVRLPGLHDATVVIRQVYAGGGGSGASYMRDFIELFNRTTAPVSLSGWSIQVAPATGTGNFGSTPSTLTPLPSVMLSPGQSLLIEGAAGAGSGAPLPTPDVVDATPLALNESGGKVALVSTTTPLPCNGFFPSACSAASQALILDLVGYGNANYYEGDASAPAVGTTTSLARIRLGCTDINSNGSVGSVVGDFALTSPSPRNSLEPAAPCFAPAPPASPPVPASDGALLALAGCVIVTLGVRRTSRAAGRGVGCA